MYEIIFYQDSKGYKAVNEMIEWKERYEYMGQYIKWEEVKNKMTSLTEKEKIEVDIMAEIISSIIKRRHELGISQRELERMTGVRQEAICRIENMKNAPQLDTLLNIMVPLGLKLTANRIDEAEEMKVITS